MYIIYLFVVLIFISFIICIVSIIKNRSKYCYISSFFFTFFIICFLVLECNKLDNVDIEERINYYNNLKIQVEIVGELQNKEFRDIFEDDLTKEMNKMNRQIRENRANYNSKWIGRFYSEKIGTLEELSW